LIILVLPAYNEEKSISLLLKRADETLRQQQIAYRVVVVNDGSSDGTAAVVSKLAQDLPAEMVDHDGNKGLGQAILTGLLRGSELAGEEGIVVTMDADNTHDPALIGAMVKKIETGKDVVIASRYEQGGQEVGLSWLRHVFSGGASFLLKFFFRIPNVQDYTCGYRAYRGAMLQRAFEVYGSDLVQERGFTCMAEVLIKMGKLGARMGEVPLILRYDLKSGPSKMKVLRTILRYWVLIARSLLQPVPGKQIGLKENTAVRKML
jgi:dolichol-phosphate mannosyltransferase